VTALVALVFLVSACGSSNPSRSAAAGADAGSTTARLVSIGAGLDGPYGLVAAVYAQHLVHAAAFAFDPEGRLWVATAAYTDAGTDGLYLVPKSGTVPVEASGIRAPVGLAYYGSDDLFVTMNQEDNLGASTPGDFLATVQSGEDWHFPACYGQGGSAWPAVPQPVAVLDKHAAVSGVAVVTGQLGPAVGSSALGAEWAVGQVQRVALTRQPTGWTGTVEPFLIGVKNPVALALGPGGALCVGDWTTGTIYRITGTAAAATAG